MLYCYNKSGPHFSNYKKKQKGLVFAFWAPFEETTDVPASVSSSCFSTAALGPDLSCWTEATRNGAAEDCLCPSASLKGQVEAVGFPLGVPTPDLLQFPKIE